MTYLRPPSTNTTRRNTHQLFRRGINAEDSDGVTGTRFRTLVAVAHWHSDDPSTWLVPTLFRRQQSYSYIHDRCFDDMAVILCNDNMREWHEQTLDSNANCICTLTSFSIFDFESIRDCIIQYQVRWLLFRENLKHIMNAKKILGKSITDSINWVLGLIGNGCRSCLLVHLVLTWSIYRIRFFCAGGN